MITGIKRIKGLGVFDNFVAANDLPECGRFNLVYGENGSGKTTLSRLFVALESGSHPEHPDLDFTIDTVGGAVTKGAKLGRKVRVFNSDYVEANIGGFDGPIRHILIVGQENKAVADALKQEIATREGRIQAVDAAERAAAKLDTAKGKIFSDVAKTIGEATSGKTLRSYRKPDAESEFARTEHKIALAEAQLDLHRATVRQEQMDPVEALILSVVTPEGSETGQDVLQFAASWAKDSSALTSRTARSAALQRLADHPDIAKWVEDGTHIHKAHGSVHCEFCDQSLPSERLLRLAEHFSVEDQQLKKEIEEAQFNGLRLQQNLSAFMWPSRLALYPELREEFDSAVANIETARSTLLTETGRVSASLDRKIGMRGTAFDDELSVDTSAFLKTVQAAQSVIDRHNKKTASFEAQKAQARSALEAHYLATIADAVIDLEGQMAALREEVSRLTEGAADLPDQRGIAELLESIQKKQAAVSSAHAGGADLTEHLTRFLGRTDLKFDSGTDGYQVLRRGKPAKRLSEGEKTAIAFIYFLVQLKDQDFDLAEGVVVIDDPISSLDSSAIYQAFAFLKNGVKDAKQVFILTHNFDFLKLLINWFQTGTKKADRTYYMVQCAESAAGREARLTPLDSLLVLHPTEYHYLFKVLHSFKSDGTILSSYHIPNIARKLLETFLEFHVPSNGSLYQKLEATTFDENKKTAIFKFANDLSHRTGKGFDPALVAETQKNTTYLLEMIQSVAPLHYAGLEKLCA